MTSPKPLWGGPYCKEPQEILLSAIGDYLDAIEQAKDELLSQMAVASTYEDGEEINEQVLESLAQIQMAADDMAIGYQYHKKDLAPKQCESDYRRQEQKDAGL